MTTFTAIIERCPETGLFVGHVPGVPGAVTQGGSEAEVEENLREVLHLLREEGELACRPEFVKSIEISIE
jgi:predicted RNase H-like HicB family nuclease